MATVTIQTSARMIKLDTTPTMTASLRFVDALGMVVGKITATNTTPATKGMSLPVTAEVRCIVTTSATINPIRNTSVNCEIKSSYISATAKTT